MPKIGHDDISNHRLHVENDCISSAVSTEIARVGGHFVFSYETEFLMLGLNF